MGVVSARPVPFSAFWGEKSNAAWCRGMIYKDPGLGLNKASPVQWSFLTRVRLSFASQRD